VTDNLPKALLPIADGRSILEYTLANFAALGLKSVALVVGYQAKVVADRVPSLASTYGLDITLVHNDRAEEWNNAYSLWCARRLLQDGAVVVNGDTLCHREVIGWLMASDGTGVTLAVDRRENLSSEDMKVQSNERGDILRISKQIDPTQADGEFIGVSLIDHASAQELIACLDETWHRDPNLFYEDGFQLVIERGSRVKSISTQGHPWIEVDTPADLEQARIVACQL
jgi:choline kinase